MQDHYIKAPAAVQKLDQDRQRLCTASVIDEPIVHVLNGDSILSCEQDGHQSDRTYLSYTPQLQNSLSPRLLRHFEATFPTLNDPHLTDYSFHKMRHFHLRAIALVRYFENPYFVTLTLPGSTDAAISTSLIHAHHARRALIAELKRWNGHKAVSYVSTFEASDSTKLHLHLLLSVPEKYKAQFTADRLQSIWLEILEELSWLTGVDLLESSEGTRWSTTDDTHVYFEPVQNPLGAAAYVTKLVDFKDGTVSKAPVTTSDGLLQTVEHWGSASRNLKKFVDKDTLHLTFPVTTFESGLVLIESELVPAIETSVGRSLSWKDHGNRFSPLGKRTWIKLSGRKTEKLKTALRRFVREAKQRQCYLDDHHAFVHIELASDGRLCMRVAMKKNTRAPTLLHPEVARSYATQNPNKKPKES